MDLSNYQANEIAGLVWCETLSKLGIIDIVISPGSRSTPLTYAFAMDERLHTYPVLDERSAGFFALGIAKQSKKPVVLLCTSGSAAANYFPAIVEARYAHTPLIVITTDRPPEQQDCHAGQTIDQTGIYHSFTNWAHVMALPEASLDFIKYARETIKHASSRSMSPQLGVVHLNVPFKEPLTPQAGEAESTRLKDYIASKVSIDLALPTTLSAESNGDRLPSALLQKIKKSQSILIVVGPGYQAVEEDTTKALLELAGSLSSPIIADALNPLRNVKTSSEDLIGNFEFLLRSEKQRQVLKPELILQYGDLPTSKNLRAAMNEWDTALVRLGGSLDNQDPSFSQLFAESVSIKALHQELPNGNPKSNAYKSLWLQMDQQVEREKQTAIEQTSVFTESVLCSHLADFIQSPCNLFISNSMVIRDMEAFWKGSPYVRCVFSNRGANGIDGIVSTAFGLAKNELPLLCMLGDLTFLHDSGAPMLRTHLQRNERVAFVLLDNDGGGLFEHLPISKWDPPFESHFAVPQNVNFGKLCEAHGLAYFKAKDLEVFGDKLKSFLSGEIKESICLHLKFNRKMSYRTRKEIAARINETFNK